MTRITTPFLAALLLTAPMAIAPLSPASAQEAIMLETLGAVRMAPPEEVKRMTDEALRRQQAEAARSATASRQPAVTTY